MDYSTYRLVVWVWIALGLITFISLFRQIAPFGRHVRGGWGPTVDNRLGWVVMEATVLVVLFSFLSGRTEPFSLPARIMLGLFVAHYVHRSLIFPWFLRTTNKRMPLAIVLSAMGFNLMNGFLIGYYFAHFAEYPSKWLFDWRFQTGLLLFLLGAGLNIQTDYALIRLRRPGETGYVIPQGKIFDRISCPNHLGEILEWTGFALLTWSLPGVAFAWWTFANLAPRALAHHRWYQQQFPDYPAGRKAWLPFIW